MAEEIASMFIRVEGKVDDAIKSLDDVNKKLGNIEKTSQQTAQTTENAFNNLSSSTLELTTAFIKVEQTMSAVQNFELRLENATERLANAQDRLADAQTNVTRSTEDAKKAIAIHGRNSEEARTALKKYEDSIKEVERAQRGLTIAQNNLTRTQHQWIGVAASVVTSAITLIGNLGNLQKSITTITTSIRTMNIAFITSPVGIIALGISLVAGGIIIDSYSKKQELLAEQMNATTTASVGTVEGLQNVGRLAEDTRDKIAGTAASMEGLFNQLNNLSGIKSDELIGKELELDKAKAKLKELTQEALSSGEKIRELQEKAPSLVAQEGIMSALLKLDPDIKLQLQEVNRLQAESTSLAEKDALKRRELLAEGELLTNRATLAQIGFTNTQEITSGLIVAAMQKVIDQMKVLNEELLSIQKNADNAAASMSKVATKNVSVLDFIKTGGKSGLPTSNTKNKGTGGDFLLRNDGTMLKFSPQDNIMGFKGSAPMGGGAVNVTVHVQGTVISEGELINNISRALTNSSFTNTNFI